MSGDWKKCQHKWGPWLYAAGWGDETHWRVCSKCKAEQEGMRDIVSTNRITAPRKK